MKAKKMHMDVGARLTTELLQNEVYSGITIDQKSRIVHLVQVHDRYRELTDTDELVLMEADSLGGMDTTRIKPSFDADSNRKFMENSRNQRLPRFITDYSKERYDFLYSGRLEYYEAKEE